MLRSPRVAAGVAGFAAAIGYINQLGFEAIAAHEQDLYTYAEQQLKTIAGLKIIADAPKKIGALSFVIDSVHPHDLSTLLDHYAIAIRAGHHCAMPLMKRLGLAATARISLGIYNERRDIDALCEGLKAAVEVFTS